MHLEEQFSYFLTHYCEFHKNQTCKCCDEAFVVNDKRLYDCSTQKIRVLFFIGSLRAGGKERRLIELISYLKAQGEKYKLLLVVTYDQLEYPAFEQLGIPCKVLGKKAIYKVPKLFFQFYNTCREFKPDIIHAWGAMQTFYSIPACIMQHIPLVNSQITSAPPRINRLSFSNLINFINFRFSKVILSNSRAGLHAYKPPAKKSRVIYNGFNPERLVNIPQVDEMKKKYGINTQYVVSTEGRKRKRQICGSSLQVK